LLSVLILNLTVNSMAQFLDLPVELVTEIIFQLDPDDDKSTLASLCLTSKMARAIAQPHLFSEFSTSISLCQHLYR
jgi:hypothetical protein